MASFVSGAGNMIQSAGLMSLACVDCFLKWPECGMRCAVERSLGCGSLMELKRLISSSFCYVCRARSRNPKL